MPNKSRNDRARRIPALGRVHGGVVVRFTNWHWIFLINVPIGILGIVLALRVWPETYDLSRDQAPARLGSAWLYSPLAVLQPHGLRPGGGQRSSWDDLILFPSCCGDRCSWPGRYLLWPYWALSMITPALMREQTVSPGANTTLVLFAAGARSALFPCCRWCSRNLWGYDQWEAALWR